MIKYKRTKQGPKKYVCTEAYTYRSPRYQRKITVEKGYASDGATGALDIPDSSAWFVHDKACDRGTWDDTKPVTAWQAAMVLKDILQSEAKTLMYRTKPVAAAWRWARSHYWFWSTYFLGCKNAKKNGWF